MTKRKALLIGAGFSKNFGGFLAEDVFLRIFNHQKLTVFLRERLLQYVDTYDFERFYEDVEIGSFSSEDKILVEKIVTEIYSNMDSKFKSLFLGIPKFSYLSVICFLINNFSFFEGGTGYIFSLNQDLLLERLFADYLKSLNFSRPGGWDEYQGGLLPHYGPINSPFYKYHKGDSRAYQSFENISHVNDSQIQAWLSNNEDTYETKDRVIPCLIKLHGSYFWRNDKEAAIWVVGNQNKEKTIQSVPILKFYYDKFKSVLSKGDLELFIIGYSFRDPHVNKVIVESCQLGTRLIIFDVQKFKEWVDKVRNEFQKIKIVFNLGWIKEYHNESFQELFPLSKDSNFKFDGDFDKSLFYLKNNFSANF